MLAAAFVAPLTLAAAAPDLVVGDARTRVYFLPHCAGYGTVPAGSRVLFIGENAAGAEGYVLDDGCSDAPREQARRDEERAERMQSIYRAFLRTVFLPPAGDVAGDTGRFAEVDCRTVPVRVDLPSFSGTGTFCARKRFDSSVSLDLYVEIAERSLIEVIVVEPPGAGEQVFLPFGDGAFFEFAHALESGRGVGESYGWTAPETVGDGLVARYQVRDRVRQQWSCFVHVRHWRYEGGGFLRRGIITYRRLSDGGLFLHDVEAVVGAVEYATDDTWLNTR